MLPTAAAAKFSSGLSVYNFLKTRTFITEDKNNMLGRDVIIEDTAKMAELEGRAKLAERKRELDAKIVNMKLDVDAVLADIDKAVD